MKHSWVCRCLYDGLVIGGCIGCSEFLFGRGVEFDLIVCNGSKTVFLVFLGSTRLVIGLSIAGTLIFCLLPGVIGLTYSVVLLDCVVGEHIFLWFWLGELSCCWVYGTCCFKLISSPSGFIGLWLETGVPGALQLRALPH